MALRCFDASIPHCGSSRIAEAWGVSAAVTIDLNSSSIASVASRPAAWPSAFFSDPRWSIAAAAIVPVPVDTAFIPASFPGVIFMAALLHWQGLPLLH